jgi:hypothetical protein
VGLGRGRLEALRANGLAAARVVVFALLATGALPAAAEGQIERPPAPPVPDLPLVPPPPGSPEPAPSPSPAPPPADRPAPEREPEPAAYAGPDGRVSLGAGWRYRADPRDQGLARGWHRRRLAMEPVELPHSPNAWPVTGERGRRNWNGSVGWYRRELDVRSDGRYAIRFESVHHRATVFLDGRRLGDHTGAYLPFEYRPALTRGRHVITLRVDWRDPIAMKRSGWHRAWFNYGGINREVTLRRLGDSEIAAPAVTTRLAEEGALVDLTARVRNAAGRRRLAVHGTLERAGQRIEFAFPAVTLGPGQSATVRRRVVVAAPALWSPASPTLYDLHLGVPGEPGWRARVGLRQVAVRDGRLVLNGAPLALHGASLHEDVPGRGDALRGADQDRLVSQLRALGANATRAQHPLDGGLLERLDAAGILVWQGIGPFDSPGQWSSDTPAELRSAGRRVLTAFESAQTHPSILVWSLANEVAWNGRRGGQARYVDWAARTLHARDPGRLVGVDIWGPRIPGSPGPLYRRLDVVGMTNYVGWYEAPFASREALAKIVSARVGRLRAAFPGKALLVTEFGAEANSRNAAGRHGSFAYQANLLGAHLAAYASLPALSGALVWNLADFPVQPAYTGGSIASKVHGVRLRPGLNQKGLYDYAGNAKPSVEVVRAAFGAPGG